MHVLKNQVWLLEIGAFQIVSGVSTFIEFVEFLKKGRVQMYILIFQLEYVLHFCLDLNDSQPIYPSKVMLLKKEY